MPCAQRATSRNPKSGAAPAATDAKANSPRPQATSRSGCSRRCTSATGMATMATVSAYVVSTHETPTIVVSNSA